MAFEAKKSPPLAGAFNLGEGVCGRINAYAFTASENNGLIGREDRPDRLVYAERARPGPAEKRKVRLGDKGRSLYICADFEEPLLIGTE